MQRRNLVFTFSLAHNRRRKREKCDGWANEIEESMKWSQMCRDEKVKSIGDTRQRLDFFFFFFIANVNHLSTTDSLQSICPSIKQEKRSLLLIRIRLASQQLIVNVSYSSLLVFVTHKRKQTSESEKKNGERKDHQIYIWNAPLSPYWWHVRLRRVIGFLLLFFLSGALTVYHFFITNFSCIKFWRHTFTSENADDGKVASLR